MIEELDQFYIGHGQSMSQKYETNVLHPDIFLPLLLAQTFLLFLNFERGHFNVRGRRNIQILLLLDWIMTHKERMESGSIFPLNVSEHFASPLDQSPIDEQL